MKAGEKVKAFFFCQYCSKVIYVHYVLINISYTHPFNGPLSGTTRVSQYQKGKTNLDITEARDSEWQWHQLGHMQVCTSLQTDNHDSTPPLSFFTGQMHFLLPNQQSQSTEGGNKYFLLANIFPLKIKANKAEKSNQMLLRMKNSWMNMQPNGRIPPSTSLTAERTCGSRPGISRGFKFTRTGGTLA